MSFRKRTAQAETAPAKKEPVQQDPPKKKSNFIKLGAILEKKDGGVYLKFDGGKEGVFPQITVDGKKVSSIQIEDPTAKYERMVNAGKMSEAEAEEAAGKVPSFVLFEVTAVTE